MAQKHSSVYTVTFVCGISIVCAFLLAFTADTLRPRIKENEKLEVKRNILEALNVFDKDGMPKKADASKAQINDFFSNRIKVTLCQRGGGDVASEGQLDVSKLTPWREVRNVGKDKARLPIYGLKESADSEKLVAYAFPIWGKGLWGSIFGYLALDSDAATVRGVTFYKHKETPGLGAEIENPTWRKQWVGKRVFNDDKLTPVATVKGGVAVKYAAGRPERNYSVDALSGATLTSNGVTGLMKKTLELYEKPLRKLREGR